MELDLTGGQSHGYVRRKVAQANGRAGDGAAGEEGTMNTMLNQVADGVWVRQSEWVWSNAIAVRGEGGLTLVDPGIDGSDLNELADDVDRLGVPVVRRRRGPARRTGGGRVLHPSALGPHPLAFPVRG